MIRRAFRKVLRSVAGMLAPYLAVTPVFWGDRSRITIGPGAVLTNTVLNSRSGNIIIEDDVFFGHDCLVLTGRHEIRVRGRERQQMVDDTGRDIVIRRGAWIASGCIIIGPCEIGVDAVVVAGTIVRADVPSGVVYGGTPPRIISHITFESAP